MTVPSVSRLLLMLVLSFMRRPSAPVLACRSLPARSTMVRADTRTAPPSSLWSPRARLSTTWTAGGSSVLGMLGMLGRGDRVA